MTRAIILAAGEGQRLRPLTDSKPKCLVPLAGEPLLERQAAVLRRCGIDDIEVVTGYRSENIADLGFSCTKNEDYATTNMVSTLFCAHESMLQSGDLVVSYGDIVYQSDIMEKLLACDDEVCVVVDRQWRKTWDLRFDDPLSDAETLIVDENGYISELGKKPESYSRIQGQYIGVMKFRSDKLADMLAFYEEMDRYGDYDGKDFKNMYMTSFLQAMIDAGWRVKAVPVDGGWVEVDSTEDLQLYERLHSAGELSPLCRLD